MARGGVAPATLLPQTAPKIQLRRNKGSSLDGDPEASSAAAPLTKLGDALASRIPSFNLDWRKHLVGGWWYSVSIRAATGCVPVWMCIETCGC